MAASAIYEGWVHHVRMAPVEHRFVYRVWMLLADLDELPQALDAHPLWSASRPAPVRFRAADHLGGGPRPLAERARELVGERVGLRPEGPVRVLTMPRMLGVGYNPVSFFYLHRSDGALEAMIAEVTNTPWRERHRYVLGRADAGSGLRGELAKRLHVSPFMPMEQRYEWSASHPGERLCVRIASREGSRTVFEAGLTLRRRELSRASMSRAMLSQPLPGVRTLARIYSQALRLRLRGAPYFRRPEPAR